MNLTTVYLEAKLIEFENHPKFRWASGMMSPVYCDHRKLLGQPKYRKLVMAALIEVCKKIQEIDAIAGVATGGIPYAAWVAESLDLPMGYVRPQIKDHGKPNRVEGGLVHGSRVLLVEDMISTGGSSLEVVKTLKAEGFKVPRVQALMTYFPQYVASKFEAEGSPYSALLEFRNFIDEPSVRSVIESNPELYANWEAEIKIRCTQTEAPSRAKLHSTGKIIRPKTS